MKLLDLVKKIRNADLEDLIIENLDKDNNVLVQELYTIIFIEEDISIIADLKFFVFTLDQLRGLIDNSRFIYLNNLKFIYLVELDFVIESVNGYIEYTNPSATDSEIAIRLLEYCENGA